MISDPVQTRSPILQITRTLLAGKLGILPPSCKFWVSPKVTTPLILSLTLVERFSMAR
jgi:hypothetical protein